MNSLTCVSVCLCVSHSIASSSRVDCSRRVTTAVRSLTFTSSYHCLSSRAPFVLPCIRNLVPRNLAAQTLCRHRADAAADQDVDERRARRVRVVRLGRQTERLLRQRVPLTPSLASCCDKLVDFGLLSVSFSSLFLASIRQRIVCVYAESGADDISVCHYRRSFVRFEDMPTRFVATLAGWTCKTACFSERVALICRLGSCPIFVSCFCLIIIITRNLLCITHALSGNAIWLDAALFEG